MRRYVFGIGLLILSVVGFAQPQVLTINDFLKMVTSDHPMAVQAQMLPEVAKHQLRAARGGFDPKIFTDISEKDQKGTRYYHISDYGFKIPTWFGVEVKGGYEYNNGTYLNPERNVTHKGLTYLGVKVPLAQGLLIDQRRAVLREAQIFRDQSVQEQYAMMNNLYFDAIIAYWDWAYAYNTWQLFDSSMVVAVEQLGQVKQRFFLGDLAAIDTLEADILTQNRGIQTLEALQMYVEKTYKLNNFLWGDQQQPLEIGDSLVPQDVIFDPEKLLPDTLVNGDFNQLVQNHPDLVTYNNKLRSLDIQRRLKAEKLKPKLNVQYNFVQSDFGISDFEVNNYKYGVNFSIPIFLREARGNLRLAKIKIQQTEQQRMQKQREIENKAKANLQQVDVLKEQVVAFDENAESYERLLAAERVKFSIGESSLFKVNAREIKLLEAQAKLIKSRAAVQKGAAKYLWSLGTLGAFSLQN